MPFNFFFFNFHRKYLIQKLNNLNGQFSFPSSSTSTFSFISNFFPLFLLDRFTLPLISPSLLRLPQTLRFPISQIPFRSSYTSKISLFLSNVKQPRNSVLRDTHLVDPPLSSSSSLNGAEIKGRRPPRKPKSSKENSPPSDRFSIPNPEEPAST